MQRLQNLTMDFILTLGRSEKDFIQACVAREKWALKILYEEYYGTLLAVCMRYSNNSDEAVDILHEGFIKIFKNIKKYQIGTSLGAWMRRIMVNTAIDYYRRQSRRRTENLDKAYELSADQPDAIQQLSEKEILQAIRELSPSYRAVFNLYVIDGYSHKEIANMLGITESTSRSNLVKARLKLREKLTKLK